jgi:hypothetical protein
VVDLLVTDDLAPFAAIADDLAERLVADAVALATLAAPCLGGDTLTDLQVAQAKAVMRTAVLRWYESGSGGMQQVGPFQFTGRKSLFWPSEIEALRNICKSATSGGAFSVDTAADAMQLHSVLGYSGGGGIYGFDIPPTDV